MLSCILYSVAAFFLISTAVLLYSLATAVEGYQDKRGFHEGIVPQSRAKTGKVRKGRPAMARTAAKSRELELAA
jgi:hypothetical protein